MEIGTSLCIHIQHWSQAGVIKAATYGGWMRQNGSRAKVKYAAANKMWQHAHSERNIGVHRRHSAERIIVKPNRNYRYIYSQTTQTNIYA